MDLLRQLMHIVKLFSRKGYNKYTLSEAVNLSTRHCRNLGSNPTSTVYQLGNRGQVNIPEPQLSCLETRRISDGVTVKRKIRYLTVDILDYKGQLFSIVPDIYKAFKCLLLLFTASAEDNVLLNEDSSALVIIV